MKIASKNLARTLVLGSVLAGGITLAQSFYNEAQATGSGGGGQQTKGTCKSIRHVDGSCNWNCDVLTSGSCTSALDCKGTPSC
jgi:hypothetical protein